MRFLLCLAFVMCGVSIESKRAYADLIVHSGPFVRNAHTYYLLEAGSWTESEATAVSLGGHLATINDAAENQWIVDTFAGTGTDGYLIGLTDSALEGIYVWTSGVVVYDCLVYTV